jgi:hypothetical protein
LTAAEVAVSYEVLVSDYENERKRPDASPDFLRLAVLRRIMFLLLEASGIRPGSAYGLALSDIHFMDTGCDFVHVRTTGEYGEAKTSSSVGFVPLEGALWRAHRDWFLAWMEEQRKSAPEGSWTDLPLFARKLGQRVRFHDDHITHRIDQLLKWASGNRKASCYWLRKVRITERYQTLQQLSDVSARDVHGMLTISGHVLIQTPVEGYINDPASLLFADLRAAGRTPRASLLAMSDLAREPGPLDVAWNRKSSDDFTRISILLDHIGEAPVCPPGQARTEPPPLRRFKPFLPLHVDAFARAMLLCKSRVEAILQAGITDEQADQLDCVAQALLVQRGCAPWILPDQTSSRSTMEVPRSLAGTEQLFGLLEREPTEGLSALANAWMEQAHIARLYDGNVVMLLADGTELTTVGDLVDKGLAMQVATVNGRHLLKEEPKTDNEKGHGAALRWILAIVWIFARLSDRAVPASSSH